jgi:cytochrome b
MVWDPALRLFHWLLVLCFVIAYGFSAEDGRLLLHLFVGYAIIGLLIFRLIWGVVGSEHARFGNFCYSRAQIMTHLHGLLRGRGYPATGHNPAGGAMVFALLTVLCLLVASGLLLDGIQRQGPLADWMWNVAHTWENPLQSIHAWLADITLVMVLLHITGALWESYLLGENLVWSMITGRKQSHGGKQ